MSTRVLVFCFALAAGLFLFASRFALAQEKPNRWTLEDSVRAPDWLRLFGTFRLRYERLANPFLAGRTGDDQMLAWQALLKAEARVGDVVFGGELLDARRLIGAAGGSSAGEVDVLEPLQLFLAWRPKDLFATGDSLEVMLGRFTMDIGGRRLVSRSGFRHPLAAFDGIKASWIGVGGVKLTGFDVAPVIRWPPDAPSQLDNQVALNPKADESRFAGLNIETRLPFSFAGEIYRYDLKEGDGEEASTRNRNITTTGVRLKRAPKLAAWDFELEYARQTGSVRATTSATDITDLNLDADFLHSEAGLTFDAPWSPRLALQYDHASGDTSPTDLSVERFDPLFGDRAFELGPTGIYAALARSNLNSAGLRLEAKPDKASDALGAIRWVEFDRASDSFGNSGVGNPTGASGKEVGTQLEVRYRRWLVPGGVRLSIGGAALSRGDFLKSAPNATRTGDAYYRYSELTFSF